MTIAIAVAVSQRQSQSRSRSGNRSRGRGRGRGRVVVVMVFVVDVRIGAPEYWSPRDKVGFERSFSSVPNSTDVKCRRQPTPVHDNYGCHGRAVSGCCPGARAWLRGAPSATHVTWRL